MGNKEMRESARAILAGEREGTVLEMIKGYAVTVEELVSGTLSLTFPKSDNCVTAFLCLKDAGLDVRQFGRKLLHVIPKRRTQMQLKFIERSAFNEWIAFEDEAGFQRTANLLHVTDNSLGFTGMFWHDGIEHVATMFVTEGIWRLSPVLSLESIVALANEQRKPSVDGG